MKISKSWLQDFVSIDESADDLAQKLNKSGTEVESVSSVDPLVVVATILKIKPHPNADKLQIATVFDGKDELQIVCGAKNIKVGQFVPLAKIGAIIDNEMINKVELRGVESHGMLCSEKELGFGVDHSGIMILKNDSPLGASIKNIIDTDDLFDVEITPNRGDCLSHLGIAREIGAINNKTVVTKPIKFDKTADPVTENISIEIIDQKNCYQYFARVIKNVKIKPSPLWLQKRLIAIGQKPINNVVDVTNYIMFDLGHPLHAFDALRIHGQKIIVRPAKNNEQIVTIDGEKRVLDNDSLVIADSKGVIALAGVMGGANSEITDKTDTIILEAAEFNPKSIRKTARKLKLTSEASYRFERGIDSRGVEYAINKAAKIIADVSDGNVCSGIVKKGQDQKQIWLDINYKNINNMLGIALKDDEINKYLRLVGFEIKDNQCKIPSWRHDIENWQDLCEEVGRLYGYDNITPIKLPSAKQVSRSSYYLKEYVKDILVNSGFVEVINYSFLSSQDLETLKIDTKDIVEIENPLQPENQYLRKSLLPNLLKNISKNPSFDSICFFEIGHIFEKKNERTSLAIVSAGKNSKNLIETAVSNMIKKLAIRKFDYKISELARDDLARFKIKKPTVYALEIDLDLLISNVRIDLSTIKLSKPTATIHYRKISKYPSVTRDLAFIVNSNQATDQIINTVYDHSSLVNRVELFDEFKSDKFGKNKKNVAFHLDLCDQNKTLTDKEADKVIKELTRLIESKYHAKVRNY